MDRLRRPSLSERRVEGRALRDRLSRKEQADWKLAGNRPDPIEVLTAAVADRDADALPLRWGRMAASPFAFFRGNTALMAQDLGGLPTTGLACQLCGDAHILNLGAYAAPNQGLVFDLNDFDETCRGPWEWDLKRLAVSLMLGGQDAGHSPAECSEAVRACGEAYRQALHQFAELGAADLARTDIDPGDGHVALGSIFEKATRDTPTRLLEKAVEQGAGGRTFRPLLPGLRPLGGSEGLPFLASWDLYRSTLSPAWSQVLDRYVPTAFGRRISGCGSLGVRNVLVLCEGHFPEDVLFLEFKAQPGSAWRAFTLADPETHRGQAVAAGQQRLQTWSDPFLGWTTVDGMPFLVRQWSDHKASLSTDDLRGDVLVSYARTCGTILAKGHARTGEAGHLSGYVGASAKLDDALLRFAAGYSEQVLVDWEALKAAVGSGKLQASP